jgi:hypothetical protein
VTGQSDADVSVTPARNALLVGHCRAARSGPSTAIMASAMAALMLGFMLAPRPCRASLRSAASVARSEWMV